MNDTILLKAPKTRAYDPSPVLMRKLQTHEEYLAAEDIQRTVWHFPEREVIPLNELVVAQKNGGHVFGAFAKGRMIGFCFGVPGYKDGKVYHYSRMLGVLPEFQDKGVGHLLKLQQRKYVLEQGLDLVRWTFDPLQSRNAYLNIEKLGCIVREYLVNVYGQSGSQFNRGLETDRFVPEWWIGSKRVKDRLAGRGRPSLERALSNYSSKGPRISVEIPTDIDQLKVVDLKAAQEWRFRTRKIFLSSFKSGYVVTGFATGMDGGKRRSLYLLEKE